MSESTNGRHAGGPLSGIRVLEFGSLLAGPRDLIGIARRHRKMLGEGKIPLAGGVADLSL